jgi:hypothetical protein
MKLRTLALVAWTVVGLTGTMAGQRATANGGKKPAPAKIEAKSVTITGCVAQGVDADHYVLDDAVRKKLPAASTSVVGTSDIVKSDKAGASDRTGPYDLQGGEFKAHLGHLVAVTGTSGSTGKAAETTPGDGVTDRKPLPMFNVQSVKLLSETCS